MTGLHLRPWEPEETIGSIWHFLVGTPDVSRSSPDAAVPIEVMRGRMGVMLRGLGGSHGFSVNEATPRREGARRSFLKRIGHVEESAVVPVSGAESLEVPAVVSIFPDRALNEAYCLWLAVWSVAAAETPATHPDRKSVV
jgi:nitric oxide reductase NorD protein